eukprot:CAMPEP_0185616766 /NCGR_PEP_ID=MMETSP0436-20130131/41018_1 /TAXON_ID=626734 ORGANISM="Favella taraikaensis, Strain Fe Narragansett Bay" /NCGR_SAMPLE_ID=MMETSP0436 /ASSEMBLY_ACC=CAM_ASM_000390 /LENGTH=165 /DNA_ID=CAMNT_0028253775 /DNA_START=290 /DNA_END=787 /DNA_ORIENTATION=+
MAVRSPVCFNWLLLLLYGSVRVHTVNIAHSEALSAVQVAHLCLLARLGLRGRGWLLARRGRWSGLLRRAEDAHDAAFWLFTGGLLNGFLKDLRRDIRVAHRALLGVLLLRAGQPLHEALVVEDVPARGHLSHLGRTVEGFHADHALWRSELVQFFVVLTVLKEWD